MPGASCSGCRRLTRVYNLWSGWARLRRRLRNDMSTAAATLPMEPDKSRSVRRWRMPLLRMTSDDDMNLNQCLRGVALF
jgi:hypothetical protein